MSSHPENNNPYLNSKLLWNDLYGDVETKLRRSQWINCALALTLVFAIVGITIISARVKVKPIPFLVHGDEIITMTQNDSSEFHALKPQLAIYLAKQFIRAVRTVSIDRIVNLQNQLAAFSCTAGAALNEIKDFYKHSNPNLIGKNTSKAIQVTSILSVSPHTLELRWREISRASQTGEVLKAADYIAQLTYQYRTVAQDKTILRYNPIGLYFTHLTWSEDTHHE